MSPGYCDGFRIIYTRQIAFEEALVRLLAGDPQGSNCGRPILPERDRCPLHTNVLFKPQARSPPTNAAPSFSGVPIPERPAPKKSWIAPAVNIGHLIETYGYVAVFLLVGAESLGVPVPGETALIVAGTYAGHTHKLNPWIIFLVASAGAIIGDNIGFWLGDKGGYRLARRYGHWVRLDEHKLKIARYVFDTHGAKVVFFGRFVSILRAYAAFLAGTSRMRWSKFLPANAAGGIVWAGIYTLISYFAGNWLQGASGTIDLVIVGVAVLGVTSLLFFVRRQMAVLGLRAEAAYPEPLE